MMYLKKNIYKIQTNKRRRKMAFKRPCKRCERIYNPSGKFSKFCDRCKKNSGQPKKKKGGHKVL